MNSVLANWESILQTIRHHVPAELTSNVLLAAGLTGAIGLVLSLWGAKVFRAVIVVAVLGLGAWGGADGGSMAQSGYVVLRDQLRSVIRRDRTGPFSALGRRGLGVHPLVGGAVCSGVEVGGTALAAVSGYSDGAGGLG